MDALNYHHLRYFWVVAKRGSIARASKELHREHPTISAQIHRLEEILGQKLFERKGRQLALTEFGHVALRYAEDIFSVGREFLDAAKGLPSGKPIRLVVGISDTLQKSIVYRILEPVFRLKEDIRVVCREGLAADEFMGELAMHTVDVVVSDAPARPGTAVRAFSRPLGECGTTFFAAPAIAKACRRRFPQSLNGIPFILPGANSVLRLALEEWFESHKIRPKIVAEMDDSALAKIAGESGIGVFAAPDVVEKEILQRYQLQIVGRAQAMRQRFYAISVERKIRNPAVLVIIDMARKTIFS